MDNFTSIIAERLNAELDKKETFSALMIEHINAEYERLIREREAWLESQQKNKN